MYIFKRGHKYAFLFISITSVLIGIGCTQNGQAISTAISKLKTTSDKGISVNIALNIAATSYVCVLSPYVSSVDPRGSVPDNINAFLLKQNYRGDEGHWTFIYETDGKWTLEQIRRKKIELGKLLSGDSKTLDSICGQADAIQLIRLPGGEVNFIIDGIK